MKAPSFALGTSAAFLVFAVASSQEAGPVEDVVFSRDVRPILSEHCFKCHGPDAATVAARLRLDSFEGATRNGAVVPGDPGRSRLIKRVSASDPADRMPPQDSGLKPLSASEIDTLRQWIAQGAKYERHWSFVTPVMPEAPVVSEPEWCQNLIDRFVLAKLDLTGLRPEPEADRNTLAQRAALALTGLQPAPKLLAEFRSDKRTGAYERYVDRLLELPEYGEHQARYWLDAVRYGDTHGLQLDNERGVFPYRDWVVRALNQDLPFDKFVEWQLAGDLLPNPSTEQLVATGYVRMNLTSNEGGAIEEEFLARNTFDRVETTGTVLLGLTVGCARCHDHKYDPLSQKEYYGLYAFFNSTADNPLDGNVTLPPPVVRAASPEQEARLATLDRTIERLLAKVSLPEAEQRLAKFKSAIVGQPSWEISEVFTHATFDAAFDSDEKPNSWRPFGLETGKSYVPIVGKDNSSVYLRSSLRVDRPVRQRFSISSDDGLKVWVNGKLAHSNKVTRGLDPIDTVTADLRAGANEFVIKVTNGGAPDGLNLRSLDAEADRVRSVVAAYQKDRQDKGAQVRLKAAYLEGTGGSKDARDYQSAVQEQVALQAAVPQSLVAQELPVPRPAFVLKRGQYDQKGEPVERHVPVALGTLGATERPNRLILARWMVSPNNPLVARVFVNRVWQQHFGTGIVKTVEDFGNQGEWPHNKPLLDALAVDFIKGGWSVKRLHRLIVMSAAFRQSSRVTEDKLAKDPENRLVSRGPRFRLDAEVIRDRALLAGGLLVRQVGGRGVKPYQPSGIWETSTDPASGTFTYVQDKGAALYRRSLYLFWKRTAPPPTLVTFDAPLRDSCTVRRPVTNTPLQALAIQNDPTFLEAARTMAAGILAWRGNDQQRLARAFDVALGRPPRANEAQVLTKALNAYRQTYRSDMDRARRLLAVGEAPQTTKLDTVDHSAWMLVCSTLMNTDEFLTLH